MRYGGADAGRVVAGVFMVLIGILWLLDMLGFIHFNICIVGPLLLIAMGVAVILRKWDW